MKDIRYLVVVATCFVFAGCEADGRQPSPRDTNADTAPDPPSDTETGNDADSGPVTTDSTVSSDTAAQEDTAQPDGDAVVGQDTYVPPGGVRVSVPHWRLDFEDDFRGKTGKPSDDYCFDELKPQCHVWPGTSYNCDLSDVDGDHFFPPVRANLIGALRVVAPEHDYEAMSEDAVKSLYGEVLSTRLADLDKCTWTSYQLVNWMATDYAGTWSARFDPTRISVDTTGKGYVSFTAAYAPIETHCIYGGWGGEPNCAVHSYGPGELDTETYYWVDTDPQWPGVYYAQVDGACPHGGMPFGPNCQVTTFPPNVLEPTGVVYTVSTDPRWPGVYYANAMYRCRDNIEYEPNLAFRNLSCPILNGGMMSFSFTNRPWVDGDGEEHPRGRVQKMGRFETKARIPKGLGAFPAAWLLPESGSWPYDGGEIDIVEARDAADEVFQTYHHGKCYDALTEAEITAASSAAECSEQAGVSVNLSRGFRTEPETVDAFWQRDHLFAVEWTDKRLVYYINNRRIGEITVGSSADTHPSGAPQSLASFNEGNFPTDPFYWILNHSTYVPEGLQPEFEPQTFRVDYVRSYTACGTDPELYCPEGGEFAEGVGCVDGAVVRPSPCAPGTRRCVNGGEAEGGRCRVWTFDADTLVPEIAYWVDNDSERPGVYYPKIGGGCPHGGEGEANCRVVAFPPGMLESGISYGIDTAATPSGIFYVQDFDR